MKRFPVVALLATAVALAVHAQSPDPLYRMGGKMDPGSTKRREAVESAQLPLNQSWAELSEADRGKVKAWYESVPPGDEPPYPAKGMQSITGGMMEVMRMRRVEGDVFMGAIVEPDGTVSSVKSYKPVEPALKMAVAAALMDVPFKPAKCGETACRMEFPVSIQFRLRSPAAF